MHRLYSGTLIGVDFDSPDVCRFFETFKYDLEALKEKAEDHGHDIKSIQISR